MNKDLEKDLRSLQGYTTSKAPCCDDCLYCKSHEDWSKTCTYNRLIEFTVIGSGRCDKFNLKKRSL